MSDEEKKMLEIFKKEVEKEQNEYEQVNEYTKFYYNNHKFILNLIEKQSKEIEELKEKNRQGKMRIVQLENEITARIEDVNKYFTPNDKIKAKIEELIKEGNYRTADNPNGRVHFQKEITDYQIEVLQSLLEKE